MHQNHKISVSNLDLFHSWMAKSDCTYCDGTGETNSGACKACDGQGELSVDWLIKRLCRVEPPSEEMLAGSAFHKALELTEDESELMLLKADDFTFHVGCDFEMTLPSVREHPISREYDQLRVNGRIDGSHFGTIYDYKTTRSEDCERLLDGYQWRYYLDITGAHKFTWVIFQLKSLGDALEDGKHYEIARISEMSTYPYPELHDDCARLAQNFFDFANENNIWEIMDNKKENEHA
jgi:hypothetical protein